MVLSLMSLRLNLGSMQGLDESLGFGHGQSDQAWDQRIPSEALFNRQKGCHLGRINDMRILQGDWERKLELGRKAI